MKLAIYSRYCRSWIENFKAKLEKFCMCFVLHLEVNNKALERFVASTIDEKGWIKDSLSY